MVRGRSAFLRIIRSPPRPFWQACIMIGVPLASGVTGGGNARPSAGRDARRTAAWGASTRFYPSPEQNDGEGENETSENGARTHDENIFVRRRQWNSSAKASPARSSAALCEIFATL